MKEPILDIKNLLDMFISKKIKIFEIVCSARTEMVLLELFSDRYERSLSEAMWQNNEFGKFDKYITATKGIIPKGKIKVIYNTNQ